ncbi:hypothetical protein [uncultured Intestinimonas sp.]|uniref:hypothetical protein n=1 Tax=uncultured Intestinimonas sp. TaxID=1689265 RepID=UPI0025FDBDE3|nr:hypothetical protein [uncultured Intestinimonas sp.]
MKKVIKQDDLICGNCAYFCQHYRKTSKGFAAVGCGHCVFPRIKQRVRDQTCPHWRPRNGP